MEGEGHVREKYNAHTGAASYPALLPAAHHRHLHPSASGRAGNVDGDVGQAGLTNCSARASLHTELSHLAEAFALWIAALG